MKLKENVIKKCRVCDSSNLQDVLDLGVQPWGNDFKEMPGASEKYPLIGVFCKDCTTFQIKHNVSKEIMYDDHTYLSGANASMPEHFQKIADKACSNFGIDVNFVADIGSNDGTLLKAYKNRGKKVLGIEPCESIAKIANESDIPTISAYFDLETAEKIINEYGFADIISAANVFYHVEELHSIVKGIKKLLAPNGIFIVQGTYLPNLIKNNEFDIIYHEHLLYYRIENLNYLLNRFGLEVFDVDFANVHGGSFIAYICHKDTKEISNTVTKAISMEREEKFHLIETYQTFAKKVEDLKSEIFSMVNDLVKKGNKVFAYGAPVKGTVMLNYCGINSDLIPYAAEVNKEKINKYIPGVDIKVLDESTLEEPDFYFLLSWNFLETFKKSPEYTSGKRKFIVPVPEPRIVQFEE